MLFYRLYRPLGRVGTVIPRGDIFDLLDIVLPEKLDYKVEFFIFHNYYSARLHVIPLVRFSFFLESLENK